MVRNLMGIAGVCAGCVFGPDLSAGGGLRAEPRFYLFAGMGNGKRNDAIH